MTSQDRTLGHPAPVQPAQPVTENHEGALIGYDRLADGTWVARLLWMRGDPLTAMAPTLAPLGRDLTEYAAIVAGGGR